MNNPRLITGALGLLLASIGAPALAADSAESLAEQAAAVDAETAPSAFRSTGQTFGAGAGPLFVGVDDVAVGAFRIDVVGDIATPAFTGAQVWGAAYDAANDRVLFNNGAELLEWPVGGAVNSLGTITDPGLAILSVTGLAFGNDTLYACRNIANEAIYEIDLNTLVATVFIDYDDANFDCGGLAFNPDDGFIYMTDDAASGGSGLFRMNMDGSGTLVTAYPPGQTDIDGLAIGDGRAYLLIDQPGELYVWDFDLAAYQTSLTSPFATSETFSGGTWIGGAGPASDLFINEIVYNPPGADGPNEYIEFRGAPSAVIPAGTYLVEIEGDAAGAGTVDRVFDLSGRTLGSNGYMVFLQQNNTYVVDPMATVATATGTGWTGLGGANDMENGTVSFLLINAPAAPTITTDVDADNDGVLDGVGATWTIVDSLAGTDGGGADFMYGNRPCGEPLPFTPAGFARIGESTGSTSTDWVCAVIAGTPPDLVLSSTLVAPIEFADRALDHIGSFNFPPLGGIEADLTVTLADAPDPVNAGENLTYTVTVTNNGPDSADEVSITLPLPAGTSFVSADGGAGSVCNAATPVACTWADATADGASRVAVIVAAVAPSTTGPLDATVMVDSTTNDPDPADDTASAATGVNAVADLAISKTNGVTASTPGTNTVYTIVASNAGPSDAPGGTVADTFPAACTGVTWTCVGAGGGTCAPNGAGNINDTVNLPDGASVTYTATCAIDPAAVGTLNNTATVAVGAGASDPVGANNSASDSDTLNASADVSLTKLATGVPDPLLVGSAFAYTLTASNAGPSAAGAAVVTDSLPANLAYVSNSCGASFAAPTLTWNIGTLAAGADTSCTLNVTVSDFGEISNTASIATSSSDSNSSNNAATDVLVGVPFPADVALTLTGDAGSLSPNPGDSFSYTVTGTNNGPGEALGLAFLLELSSGLSFQSSTCGAVLAGVTLSWDVASLADGASTNCVITVTLIGSGLSSTSANVSTTSVDPDLSNNTAQLVVATRATPIPANSNLGLLLGMLLFGMSALIVRRRY
jgi:uncharacterized repeat protein (TIGR01451 family)